MMFPVHKFLAPILVATIAASCGSDDCRVDEPEGIVVRFDDPNAGPLSSFVAHPWPSDARLREDGTLRLAEFPNPTESTTLEDYIRRISVETHGFAKNGAVYLSMTGAIDPASLPATPADAMKEGAAVQLIDIDPGSPDRGRRFPLLFQYDDEPRAYLNAPHNLAALPPFGASLRDRTTYALLITDSLEQQGGEPVKASRSLFNGLRDGCTDDVPSTLRDLLGPLRSFFDETDADAEPVVGATVFTTRDVLGEMRTIAEVADAHPVPEVTALELRTGIEKDEYIVLYGAIEMPAFQAGDLPYLTPEDGGRISYDPMGVPQVTHTEPTRLAFTIPKRPMPASGWPVVLYSHGTGGSYRSVLSDTIALSLAEKGIAAVGYDQTLHGTRDPTNADTDITFFNLFNIVAARDNVRQGAVDLVVMTNILQAGLTIPASLTQRDEVRFNKEKIAFVGHSQGGLVGAPFMAVEPAIKAAVFSGTSGILTITLIERKDPLDFAALLGSLIGFPDDEPLDDFHPVLNMIQTFIEPADPISYVPSYLEDPPEGADRDILFVEGFLDFASPARGHEALAAAAKAPLISPHHRNPLASDLLGPAPQAAPAEANVQSAAGPVTMGLIQYPQETHFPIFRDGDARRRYLEFVRSRLFEDRARIIEPTQQ